MHYFSSRIRILSIFIILFSLILVGKLYLLQVVNGEEYSERADRQYVRPNQNLFDRGSIFFEGRDGEPTTVATLKSGFTLVMNPKLLSDPKTTYVKLSSLVDLDADSFFAKSAKKDDPYEEIAKKIEYEKGIEIDKLELPGISLYKDKWRYYPGNEMASHVLGFVGYKGDVLAGRYGLESYYEDVLERDGSGINVNFFAELFADINKTVIQGKSREGDIVTTIDTTAQNFFETQIQKISNTWKSSMTGGVVIDPKTGEIYAMAVTPDFDPNQFNSEKSTSVFRNPIIEDVFEMGSIIKPLTIASGIDSGTITSKSTYYDEGFLVLNGKKISNHDGRGRGTVNMQEVLSQSLNTGVAYVADKMGPELFGKYMLSYGIGEETGIDLPNEAVGLIENLKGKQEIGHATASYGQGIALTPIATVRALSALANGGKLINPHVVKRIEYKVGYSKEILHGNEKQVIDPGTAEDVTRMLVEVVDKALLHGEVKMEHWSIAAKTGTAQIAKEGGGGYYDDRFLHSFFGYFPAYDPKFLVFLYTVHPKGVTYASETLTHPFMDIAKFLINYYEITPDR